MKKYSKVLTSLFLMTISNMVLASPIQQAFVGRLLKQINYVEENQAAVWPGFHPKAKPTVIEFFTEDYQISAFAINFIPGNLPWEKLSIENSPVYYLDDPSQLNIINDDAFTEIDGQMSFVDIENYNFLGLENVHPKIIAGLASLYLKQGPVIDPAHAKYLNAEYDDFNNLKLLKLLYLEDRALTLAQQDDRGLAEEALRNAVAIHQYRNTLTTGPAREFENGLEIMDGVPTFIGWRSQQLNDTEYRKKTQRSGCMPLNALAGPLGFWDCVMSGFPAYASSVYGEALDKKISALIWKQKVENEFKSPSQLAIEYYQFSNEQAKQMTEALYQNPEYDYTRIGRVIDYTMGPYLQSLDKAKATYHNMSGFELRLPFDFGYLLLLINALNGGDNISNFYIVNNHVILLEDINMESDDDEFSFKHLPYLSINEVSKGFEVDEDNSYTTIKLSEDAKIVFDDETTMIVNEFVRNKMVKSFHKLLMKDESTRLLFDREATLDASQGVLVLKKYEPQKMAKIKVKHVKELLHEGLARSMVKQTKAGQK